MGNYQVLFSGDVSQNVKEDTVRENLAKILGIDERKAKQLFSGRTVVIKSQLSQTEALEVQTQFAELGAICRVKDLTPQTTVESSYKIDKHERSVNEHTLRDITAAHVECPRCGYLQLEASHCSRCGIDVVAALKQKRKEDLLIEKKIRDLRTDKSPAPRQQSIAEPEHRDADVDGAQKKRGKVMSWLRKSG
ncbi:MAG: hypothetical protein V3T18_12190 [Pseudomonadales bacterium]